MEVVVTKVLPEEKKEEEGKRKTRKKKERKLECKTSSPRNRKLRLMCGGKE